MSSYFSPEGISALAFAALSFFVVARRARIHGTLLPIDYSILFMAMIYGISWPAIMGSITEGRAQYIYVYGRFHNLLFLNTIAAAMAVIGLLIGWNLAMAGSRIHSPNVQGVFSSVQNPTIYAASFWIMLIVAVGSQVLYTMDYGGLFGAIEYSRLIRSGLFDSFIRSRFSFLEPFGDFAFLACFGFWGLILSGWNRTGVKLGFIASLIVSLYVLYLNQGRLNAVAFFAIIAMTTIYVKAKRPAYIFTLALIAIPSVIYATYGISNLLKLNSSNNLYDFYIKEISFIFVAFFAQLGNPDGLHRFFYDAVTYPAYLLPSSMTAGWLNDPSVLNTTLIHGAPKGQHGITSSMPVDIVTMGLMQMNFAGIIPYAMLYGALMAAVHRICMSVAPTGLRATFYAYICIKIAGIGIFYAHPATVVVGNFALIVVLLVAIIGSWLRRIRSSGADGFA